MSRIPSLSFRLSTSFSLKPPLEADVGPGSGVLVGRTSTERDETQAVFMGKMAERPYSSVWLDTRGAHVVYLMGKRRSGKSYTLGALAEALVSGGWLRQGGMRQGVLILDTMNVYLTMPFSAGELSEEDQSSEASRWKLPPESVPVALFHPRGTTTPPGLRSTEFTLRPSDLQAEEWCGLFDADPFADPLGHLMTELHGKVALDGYYDAETEQHVPAKPDFGLEDLLSALAADPALDQYHTDTKEALRRRLEVLRRLPLFSDAGSSVSQLLEPNVVTVLLLRDLDQQIRSVLVGFVVRKVMQGRAQAEQSERMLPIYSSRAKKLASTDPGGAEEAKRLAAECRSLAESGLPRSWILIDEAHNYIPRSGFAASRKPLKKYVDEGRNLGLSIVVATQQPSGLEPSIQRNADVLFVHSLSHRDDIRAASGMLNTAVPEEVMLGTKTRIDGPRAFEVTLRNLPVGYALVSNDKLNRVLPVLVRPRTTIHGGQAY